MYVVNSTWITNTYVQILDLLVVYIVIVNTVNCQLISSFLLFTCLCQEIVGDGNPEALHESFKLEKKHFIWHNLLDVYIYYLESFLTVKFFPAWDVVILGGTENWKILNQSKTKLKDSRRNKKSWQIYLQWPAIDGKYF